MTDKAQLISELKRRISRLPPLQDEPDFSTSDQTLIRFLKSRDWDLAEAERMLTDSIEYRRKTRPLLMDCSWCHNRPGYHSMRQVGHDEAGRPVIYSNFAQAATHKNSVEDSVAHVTYLIENAKRTMSPGVSSWVFVIDCTGMTLSSCNPKLGYGVTNVLSNHYPERLGLVVCLNHSPVFHGVWKAIKQFLHPQTAAKVKLVRSKGKTAELFSQLFDAELSSWLQEEIALNKQKPLPKTQVEFWSPPSSSSEAHDPRGCPAYVSRYLETFHKSCQSHHGAQTSGNATASGDKAPAPRDKATAPGDTATAPRDKATGSGDKATAPGVVQVHKPHPNIVDHLSGRRVAAVTLSEEELQERQRAQIVVEADGQRGGGATEGEEEEEEEPAYDLDIPKDLQIPATAMPLFAPS